MMSALRTAALVLAFGDPVYVDQSAVEQDVRELLADERYAFCDVDGDYEPIGREADWCPTAAQAVACPGWVTACTRAKPFGSLEDLIHFGGWGERGDGDGSSGGGDADRSTRLNPQAGMDDPPEPPPEPELTLPDMSGLAKVILWVLVLGFAAWLIYTILQRRVDRDGDRDVDDGDGLPPDDGASTARAGSAEHRRVVETDVDRLLERARQAAQRGQLRDAIDDTYAALVRRLEGEGLIEVHPSLTNGDYLQRLRPRPELRAEVDGIVRDVERVQFGDAPPDEPTFRRIFDRVAPLARRTLTSIAMVLGLGAITLGCPNGDRGVGDQDEHAGLGGLERRPLGARALVQTLRRNELTAHHRVRTINELTGSDATVLLFGDVDLLEDEWATLLEWVDEGHTLVIATGGWIPDELGFDSVPDLEPAPPEPIYDEWGEPTGAETDVPDDQLTVAGPSVWDFEYLTLSSPRDQRVEQSSPVASFDPLLYRGPDIYAVAIHRGDGDVLLFADEHLFTNISMATSDNAFYVTRIFADRGEEVDVVNFWIGRGADTPFEAVRNSNMLPFLLQLLAFMLLLYVFRGAAFSRLRDPPARSRRAFAEHVDALGMQYAKARASRYALGLYAGYVFEQLRERVQSTSTRGAGGLHAMAQAIALKTGRDESEIMRILVEAHDARGGSGPADLKEDLRLMRELTRLLDQTSGRR